MKSLIPDLEDRESFIALLLTAEVLTKRGEIGPLSRVFVCRPKTPPKTEADQETSTSPGNEETK